MYIYTEDDDRWMRAERAARERNQDVSDKVQKARIEVAREIFADIEEIITYRNYPIACDKLKIDFAELKKKYIGE